MNRALKCVLDVVLLTIVVFLGIDLFPTFLDRPAGNALAAGFGVVIAIIIIVLANELVKDVFGFDTWF